MKYRIRILLALLCLSQGLFASITVKGRVLNRNTSEPMEYATVSAFSLPDTTLVTGVITEPTGHFTLQLEKGRYLLQFQYMGFVPFNKSITLTGEKTTVDLGKILLAPDEALLDEVEVVAEVSTYEMTLDKRVFNVGKDVSRRWID